MSDTPGTITPRAPRQRNANRPKRRDGDAPITPGRSGTPRQPAVEGDYQGPGYHSSSGRLQKNPNGNKLNHNHNQSSSVIPSLDGAASPAFSSRPITIQPRNENQNQFATPAKQAYAGPTFHASPAPSSLPMPKFFSKSLPSHASPAAAAIEQSLGEPLDRSIPPSPGPAVDQSPSRAPVHRESSPLDLLFNAHRAEQERQKAGTGTDASIRSPRSGLGFRPPVLGYDARSSEQGAQPSGTQNIARDGVQRVSGKEMFMMDVDGSNAQQDRETYNTPSFEQRLRALQAQGPSKSSRAPAMDDEQRLAKSLALKQLLKGQGEQQAYKDPPHTQDDRRVGLPQQGINSNPGILPAQPQENPSSAQRQDHYQLRSPQRSDTHDLKSMEASLKKLLKLNP